MNDDRPNSHESTTQLLPDGIGLSVDEVREMLHRKHNISIPADDPMLMMVTVCNAFLTEQARLQKAHEKALGAFMNEQTSEYVTRLAKEMQDLSKTLSDVTVDGIRKSSADFAASMASHRSSLFLCTAITALAALLIVGVFILRAVL